MFRRRAAWNVKIKSTTKKINFFPGEWTFFSYFTLSQIAARWELCLSCFTFLITFLCYINSICYCCVHSQNSRKNCINSAKRRIFFRVKWRVKATAATEKNEKINFLGSFWRWKKQSLNLPGMWKFNKKINFTFNQ
jgi:hypothetical protein